MVRLRLPRHRTHHELSVYSWVSELVRKLKELITAPNLPELQPIPVRKNSPRRPRK